MPLPLIPFERYMLEDDRDDYPMTFAVVVELHGEIDSEAMESAVLSALVRHPLTCAQIEKVDISFQWIAGTLPHHPITWHRSPFVRLPFAGARVNLFSERGFRVDAFRDGYETCLMFSTHHAITDGLGMLQIIGDVLALYGIKTAKAESKPQLPEVDAELLRGRGVYDVELPHPISRWTTVKAFLAESWKLLSRRPVQIVTHKFDHRELPETSGYVCVSIDEEQFAAARERARELGAGFNHVLVSALFQTVKQWQEVGGQRCGKWLRVTLPTSLRSRKHQRSSAANILGYVMITRKPEECECEESLLKSIVSELKFVQNWAIGTMFSTSVATVDRVPGLLRWMSRRSRRVSTIVLSNVGEVTHRFRGKFAREHGSLVAGNLKLVNVTAAPPVRPGTSLAIGIGSCGGKVNFCAQFDAKSISAGEVRQFLNQYASVITRTAEDSDGDLDT